MKEKPNKNFFRLYIIFIGGRKFRVLTVITVVFGLLTWKLQGVPEKDSTEINTVDFNRDCGDLDKQATYRLKRSGSHRSTKVHAASYWNASGIIFEKGVTYNIRVINPKQATWKDDDHEPSPHEGWELKEGWLLSLSKFAQFVGILRAPEQDLFVLMGALFGRCEDGRTCAAHFPIGNGADFTAPADGEFCAYANDLQVTYWYNSGSVIARITRK